MNSSLPSGQAGPLPPAQSVPDYIAFIDGQRVAEGPLADVARVAAQHHQGKHQAVALVFDAAGRQIDLDLRGTPQEAAARAASLTAQDDATRSPGNPDANTAQRASSSPLRTRPPAPARGRGRPQLGVVAREVTLLPRHWEWLAAQRGGASAALRRLVDGARKEADPREAARHAQERTYRFLTAIAGNLPGYEEALRALFAGQAGGFSDAMRGWPQDVASHAQRLADGAFQVES